MLRTIADARCDLGEGPLWAGGRLYWFDINGRRLHACGPDGQDRAEWAFDEPYSAGARLSTGGMLIASASGLWRFNPESGARDLLAPLEADNPATRSNDGRADRQGGFWIGTMGRALEPGLGAIYRYYKGELRTLREGISISNSICFSPDGRVAYFADTPEKRIMRWDLDDEGWPVGEPTLFIETPNPDGSVVDSAGNLWNAQWGFSRVNQFAPDGRLIHSEPMPASQVTCPCFGGEDLKTLYVTSAREGLGEAALADQPQAGGVFAVQIETAGLADPVVIG